MSRTYKDKDYYLSFPEEKWDYTYGPEGYNVQWIGSIFYRPLQIKGRKTKKPRNYKGNWKWYKQTPSWFVREFMTVPKRAACRNWEQRAKQVVDFENFEDCPDFGRKPHVYYY